MTPETKRRAALYASVACLAALSAILCLWAFSKPHTDLEYMVGGTLGTTILLAGAFVQLLRRGYLGQPSRRAQINPPKSPSNPITGP